MDTNLILIILADLNLISAIVGFLLMIVVIVFIIYFLIFGRRVSESEFKEIAAEFKEKIKKTK